MSADEYDKQTLVLAKDILGALPPMQKFVIAYFASKVATEQAFWEWAKNNKPHFSVNAVLPCSVVQDVARLHVADLIHPAISDEPIFAFAASCSINDFFDIFAKVILGYKARETPAGLNLPLVEIGPREKAEALLKDLGRPGFVVLEETITDSVQTRTNAYP